MQGCNKQCYDSEHENLDEMEKQNLSKLTQEEIEKFTYSYITNKEIRN